MYLWSTSLYETYAPYVQSQLPDVNIEFIVGNNDLDFYKFLQENGGLPDIITCCRFSLHDAAPLKDSLMNLAMTNEAGAVYNTYLNSFKNEDGSVNWLPVCADAHGFVVNRSLFEQYDIPLPTDYESFVAACQAFETGGHPRLYRRLCLRLHLHGNAAGAFRCRAYHYGGAQVAHCLQRPRQHRAGGSGRYRVAGGV